MNKVFPEVRAPVVLQGAAPGGGQTGGAQQRVCRGPEGHKARGEGARSGVSMACGSGRQDEYIQDMGRARACAETKVCGAHPWGHTSASGSVPREKSLPHPSLLSLFSRQDHANGGAAAGTKGAGKAEHHPARLPGAAPLSPGSSRAP